MEESEKPNFPPALFAWAAVTVLAIATAWAAEMYFLTRAEVRLLTQQKELAEMDAREARNELEAERLLNRRERAEAAPAPPTAPARP